MNIVFGSLFTVNKFNLTNFTLKPNNLRVVKILCAFFLIFTFYGGEGVNAQFLKKNKQGDKKVTAKKTAAKKSAVLEQSTKPELIFGNFAGNMCSS